MPNAHLELDWRKLYDIYKDLTGNFVKMSMKIYPSGFEKLLRQLIKCCRPYFSHTATREILTEFRPYFCPHDPVMSRMFGLCCLFLPTLAVTRDAASGGWRLSSSPPWRQWCEEFLVFWRACDNCPSWEGDLLTLLARLAEDNPGFVSWDQEVVTMVFQRMMASFELPVEYKGAGAGRACSLDTHSLVRWLVASLGPGCSSLAQLHTLLRAVAPHFHAATGAAHQDRLVDFLSQLIHAFSRRLHGERHRDTPTWQPAPPRHARLTDLQVTSFSEAVAGPLLELALSPRYVETARQCSAVLAAVCPGAVVPALVARLAPALASPAPHLLTSTAKCLGSVARLVARPGPGWPEAPTHILPMLEALLPGLDCNDLGRTMAVLQLISIYGRLVPMVDLTSFLASHSASLTPIEKTICSQSSRFLPFVMEFLSKCFSLIDNVTLEDIHQEASAADTPLSSEETGLVSGLGSCLHSLLHRADPAITEAATAQLEQQLLGRQLEPGVAGRLAASLLGAVARVAPRPTLARLLPRLCGLVTSSLPELLSSPRPGPALLPLQLLGAVLQVPGCHVLPHAARVADTVASLAGAASREAHTLALSVLRQLLAALSQACLLHPGAPPPASPLQDWGRGCDPASLALDWWLPGEAEFSCCAALLDRFLAPQLARLGSLLAGEQLDREELHRSLQTIAATITGAGAFLQPWAEDPVTLLESAVDLSQRSHDLGPSTQYDYKYRGENTRRAVVGLMEGLAEQTLQQREDDTRTLTLVTRILELAVFHLQVSEEQLGQHEQDFQQSKQKLGVRLYGSRERHIRTTLLDRALLQHQRWLAQLVHRDLTGTHVAVLRLLVTLATSGYSQVRGRAQAVLARALDTLPGSHLAITDQLLGLLGPAARHEQLKGALYILLQNRLLLTPSWGLQCRLWPALVRSPHSEKPSISALLRSVSGRKSQ